MSDSALTMYGAAWCSDCRRSKKLLDTSGISYEYVDLEARPEAAHIARGISGRTSIPVIVFPDGSHLVEPTDDELQGRITALV